MKKVIMLMALAIPFTLIGEASAGEGGGMYVSAKLGAAFAQDADASDASLSAANIAATFEMDTGYASSVAVGTKAGDLRFEGELGYQVSDMDKLVLSSGGVTVEGNMTGDLSILSGMVNAYYDFPVKSNIKPYILLGVGMANVSIDDATATLGATTATFTNEDDTVFAGQVGAGLGFPLSQQLTLDVEYRYFFSQDADFDGTDVEIASHNIFAGLRYSF